MNEPTSSPSPQATPGPLSPEHYQELQQARDRAKKVQKAAAVAGFNAKVTGIFAVLSAPFALFSIAGLLTTLGLAVVAWNEHRGRNRLLKFEPAAATGLGWNQVGFLTLIVVYCCWMLYTGLTETSEIMEAIKSYPELEPALAEFGGAESLNEMLVVGVYGTVIVLSVIFQGLNALYYFTRRKVVGAYLHETPAWVVEFQRSGLQH